MQLIRPFSHRNINGCSAAGQEISRIQDYSHIEDVPVGLSPSALDRVLDAQELSRPRARYFLYYPLVLAAVALMLWLSPTDSMTAVTSGIATAISVLMMWEFLFTSQVIRFSNVCAMGLVIGYGAGTLNSWLTLPRAGLPLAAAIGQTVPELANGVAAAMMGCAILLSLGEMLEKPVWTTAQKLRMTHGIKRLVLVNFIILAVAFAAGMFHQGGIKASSASKAGFVSIFLSFLLRPTVILETVIFLVESVKAEKYLFGGIALLSWLLLVTQGRSGLVYSALLTIALARYSGFRWGRISVGRLLLFGAAFALLFVGVLTYQLLRLAGGRVSSHSLSAETSQAQEWVEQGRAWEIATASSTKNVEGRTLVVTFLSGLLYLTETEKPAYGKDLLLQIGIAIPSIIYKNKPTIAEEDLASKTFGVFYTDQPNSIFTAGAVDFGMWGVMIYPIVFVLLFSLAFRLEAAYFSYEVSVYGLLVFLLTAISAEEQLADYFGPIRNLLIFAIFIYLVSKVPRIKLRPMDGGGGQP